MTMRIAGILLVLSLGWVAACGEPAVDDTERAVLMEECHPDCGGSIFVFNHAALVLPDENGHVRGWNFDGIVNEDGGREGCYTVDHVSPDGEKGIDNQFANFLPALGAESGEAIEDAVPLLLENAIHDGGILILTEIFGSDDWSNADSVGIGFRRGTGIPLLGTDGSMLQAQTFSLHEEPWMGGNNDISIVDGVIDDTAGDLAMAITVFGVEYRFTLRQSRFEFEIAPDGSSISGILGGLVPTSDVVTIGEQIEDRDLGALVSLLGPALADVRSEEDGPCDLISAVVEFSGIPAFVYPE